MAMDLEEEEHLFSVKINSTYFYVSFGRVTLTNCMVATLIVFASELAQTSALKIFILCIGLCLTISPIGRLIIQPELD